jgi:hypothetical protein
MLADRNLVSPLVVLVFYGVNFTLVSASSKDESVLPRSPCDAVNSSLRLDFVSLDPLALLLLPDTDSPVVPTSSQDIFILRVSPGHLPNGAFMSFPVGINFNRLLSIRVFVYTSDLNETIAVDRSQAEAVKVKLTVVDITVVFSLLRGSRSCIRVISLHF